MTTCLFIRYVLILPLYEYHKNLFSAIYCTIELAGGWNRRIIRTQIYFSTFVFLVFLYSPVMDTYL